MLIIQLTHDKQAVIDDIDAAKTAPYKWYSVKNWNTWYARGYIPVGRKGRKNGIQRRVKFIYLHRLIMNFPNKLVDHRDGNGLNCRRDNLRIASPSQNNMNMRMRSGNISGFRGVTIIKNVKKRPWCAQLKINGKTVFRKSFANIIDAAKAYNEASLKHHGEFGYRNFIPEQ